MLKETSQASHDAQPSERPSLGASLAKGLVAGVLATGVLVGTRDAMYAREDPSAREREEEVREGAQMSPLQRPARDTAEAVGVDLDKQQERALGRGLAWGASIGFVVAYAALRSRYPKVDAGQGLAFGLAAWALEDETLMPALGFSKGPLEYPWQAHARGLAAHLAYGVAAETTLDVLDRVA